jgi:hypothetical protein
LVDADDSSSTSSDGGGSAGARPSDTKPLGHHLQSMLALPHKSADERGE